jgi:hypothetical protein
MKYVFCAAFEEFLEMIGIVVFIYALLTYLVQGRREVALALELHVYQEPGAKHLAGDGGEEDRSLEHVPTGRDRDSNAHEVAHGTGRNTSG